jgi:hypothetical protein
MSVYPAVSHASVAFGGNILSISGTDISVNFNSKMGAGSTYNSNTGATDWGTTYFDRWRVKIVSGGASVGYPVSARNVVGDTSGTAVPSGFIGEKIEATITQTIPSTSEADITGASLPLTPGRWEIHYSVTAQINTGATASDASRVMVAITNASNTHIGKSERIIQAKTVAAVSNTILGCLSASCVVDISADTTYKLRSRRTDVAGTGSAVIAVSSGNYDCVFYAVRIA